MFSACLTVELLVLDFYECECIHSLQSTPENKRRDEDVKLPAVRTAKLLAVVDRSPVLWLRS